MHNNVHAKASFACRLIAASPNNCLAYAVSQRHLLQAPVPYLNRAIAEEQLGVDAAAQQNLTLAQQQFAGAVTVS